MTINYVQEMWSRQTGSDESTDGKTFKVSYTSAYQVSHSADATLDEIRNADGIPVLRSRYPGTLYIACTKRGDVQRIGPCYSIVPVYWSGETGKGTDNPLDKPPEIDYYAVTSEAEVDTDGTGAVITNVNGEPVNGLKRTITDMILQVRRNYASFNAPLALQYMDSVNSDNFVVFGQVWQPGQAAMTKFRIKPIEGDQFQYFAVDCEITLRQPYNTVPARAWWSRYRNEGFYERTNGLVTFSGGGGSGAKGYAITLDGAVTGIAVTDGGYDYTSAPSVSVSGGSGAYATASVSGGRVTSVSVFEGGSGYISRLVRAVDANRAPVTTPVLLKANGEREHNAQNAVWLQRQMKQYQLPYNALGLF